MGQIISFLLDIILIGLLITGIAYAVRLMQQMAGLRASRAEMERFVADFSATVQRAEAGIRGLKQAARTGGDDLEQLIEKAQSLRDELQFLVESADQIASRLSDAATTITRTTAAETAAPLQETAKEVKPATISSIASAKQAPGEKRPSKSGVPAPSAAERELLQALEKLG